MLMIFCNNVEFGSSFRPTWILFIFLNCCVGFGAPILWTAQSDYIGRCAVTLADQGDEGGVSLVTSRLSGNFFTYFQFSGSLGTLLSSLVLMFSKSNEGATLLFNILGALVLASLVGFACGLPRVAKKDGTESHPAATIRETLMLAFTDQRTGLAVPITLCNGMMLGFFFASYATEFICPVGSAAMVGFVLATFFAANALSTFTWGYLLGKGKISRTNAFKIATLTQMFLLAMMMIAKAVGFQATYYWAESTQLWVKINNQEINPAHMVFLFLGAIIFAFGDSVYESQVPAVFQTLYADDPKSTCAYANTKMWQSLGFALQFAINSFSDAFVPKVILLLVLLILSILFIIILNRRCPFDSPRSIELAALSNGREGGDDASSSSPGDKSHFMGITGTPLEGSLRTNSTDLRTPEEA